MSLPKYSVIIPVYNRPLEVNELLESLSLQTNKNFEVILIEDGSSITSETVYEQYADKLSIHYFFKPNSGPGPSRNFGFERAKGEYFVVFDSDCVVPDHYFETVDNFLLSESLDAWGGPDRGRQDFTNLQQAMGFTMSSILTTGGIRGGKQKGFQPRSFNMGISRKVFEQTGGFKFDRFAEDIELSVRMKKLGFRTGLIPDAYVYHKRRTSFSQFFKQVSNFGKGRVLVGKAHPGEIKVTHWFPAFFLIGLILLPAGFLFFPGLTLVGLTCYFLYLFLISLDCFLTTRSITVSILSIPSAIIQLTGYGYGFLKELFGSK
ncbi:MAG TPA: glycosyltransferase [Cyclobacteriaceae bacterium]|nr:glycosyltransferase [Cyclobacteriaceae bacterium]